MEFLGSDALTEENLLKTMTKGEQVERGRRWFWFYHEVSMNTRQDKYMTDLVPVLEPSSATKQ
jgi:hypothetical protein